MALNNNVVTPDKFSIQNWFSYFHAKSQVFVEKNERMSQFTDDYFNEVTALGDLEFNSVNRCGVFILRSHKCLTERSSRRRQFDKAKRIIEQENTKAGIFIFYDDDHSFRLSLVYPVFKGTKRTFSNYRRHSFFVSPDLPNKTYIRQLKDHNLDSMNDLKDLFSVEKVSDLFYHDFEKEYALLKTGIKHRYDKEISEDLRGDYALLFVIRIIFLGFVQKKGWLGDNNRFISDYINVYDPQIHPRGIYEDLLEPLFFKALNESPSQKNKYGFPNIPQPFQNHLVKAPYLNGGLFREHDNYDRLPLFISNDAIRDFIKFLFSFNFTLEENTLYDEDLELNPEFLGIIFEKLINKAHGAIYTPRLEVDFMCRLSLIKYLQQNSSTPVSLENLYTLFFPEYGCEEERSRGNFTTTEAKDLLEKLETVTVCDPAIGSGAFAVGMLNVIDEIESTIHDLYLPDAAALASPYERKKRIIFQSLYGVEVKQWAVWITQLRLWITLLIEAEDSLIKSEDPLLPSFDFKIKQGDSLIQMMGDSLFPISGKDFMGSNITRKIKELEKLKTEYFHNKCPQQLHEIEQKHIALYTGILDNKKKDLQKKLNRMKDPEKPEYQADVFNTEYQAEIDFASQKIKRENENLKLQIDTIDDEIQQISAKNLPFIWRIDFPEIIISKGGFDIVIGNPPYVAQEQIEDPQGIINDNKEYKELLKQMAKQDFPDDIPLPAISGKSDLYTFFYIRGIKLLNPQGVLTYICSNSWLDVDFGTWLQKFLLDRCQIHFIIDTLTKRVFRTAGINTIISVIGARQKKVSADDLIRFVAFKLPFENSLYLENFLSIEEAISRKDFHDLRINPVTRGTLLSEGVNKEDRKYRGSKWGGIYIKAPDIYFTIMGKAKDKLVRLGDIAEITRGYTTGANDFFYTRKDDILINNIGTQYWHPAIRSSKYLNSLEATPEDIQYKLLIVNEDTFPSNNAYLKKHIAWGESKNFHKRPTVQNRSKWYYLPKQEIADFVQGQIINDRFLYTRNQKYLADCVLNLVYLHDEYRDYSDQMLVSLNSSFNAFMTELSGRTALGEGALKAQVFEIADLLVVNPKLIKATGIKSVIAQMSKRQIGNIFHELGIDMNNDGNKTANPLPDRKALDNVVFQALGLTNQEIKALYAGLLELTSNRLNKAGSFK